MELPARTTARALVISFAAVAVTFTMATAIAQIASLEIRSSAREITGNTTATISLLSSMRGTMRRLEVGVDELTDDCRKGPCDVVPPPLAALRNALVSEWDAYRKLSASPGESATRREAERELRAVDDELTRLYAALRRKPSSGEAQFHSRVQPAFDRLDAAVLHIIEADHAHGVSVATRIDALARRSVVLSIVLGVLSIGLTALAAVLAISFVRRHERSLRARAEELDQFAGRVAHDVLGPLWATSAALHVAQRGADEQGLAALERGRRSVELVQQLVKGLLEFARSSAHSIPDASADVGNVLGVVLEHLRPVAEHGAVELQVGSPITGRVACSPGLLTSILSNVVGNAIKHMGDSTVRRVLIHAGPLDGRGLVRIEIADTGPGISAELGTRVFEPFVRGSPTGPPGFGLGLATVKRIVTTQQGRIGFTSDPGRGTVFWVELAEAPCVSERIA